MPFASPIGLLQAIASLAKRRPLPTALSSRELQRKLSADLRRTAQFSAKIEDARALQTITDVVSRITQGATPESQQARDAGKAPVVLSVPEAKRQLEETFRALGVGPEVPQDIGTIKDPTSDKRLQLIVTTQESIAHGYGRYAATQDADVMDMWPAWELVRVSPVTIPRGFKRTVKGQIVPKPGDAWPDRWKRAGGTLINNRMVALKNAEIWSRLGDPKIFDDGLGNPYPPFAFNSGMDVRDIRRSEAESLGLIERGAPAPTPQPRDLAQDLAASAEQFDAALQAALEADPTIAIEDGVLRIATS